MHITGSPEGFDAYDDNILREISDLSFETLHSLLNPRLDSLSHKIVRIERKENEQVRITILSPLIMRKLFEAQAFRTLEAKRQVCEIFSADPHVSSARDWAFEEFAHVVLSQTDDGVDATSYELAYSSKRLSMHRYTPRAMVTDSEYSRQRLEMYMWTSPDEFRKCLTPTRVSRYWRPTSHSNPGFDSFVVTETDAYIFQMTVSDQYRVDSETQQGIAFLEELFPKNGPFHLHYVLVVPNTVPLADIALTHIDNRWIEFVSSFQLLVLDVQTPLQAAAA